MAIATYGFTSLSGYEEEIARLANELTSGREEVEEARAAVKKQKESVARNNKDINTEAAKSAKISKANEDKRLRIQELKHKISKVRCVRFLPFCRHHCPLSSG